jgi:hypothetical protein
MLPVSCKTMVLKPVSNVSEVLPVVVVVFVGARLSRLMLVGDRPVSDVSKLLPVVVMVVVMVLLMARLSEVMLVKERLSKEVFVDGEPVLNDGPMSSELLKLDKENFSKLSGLE